MLEQVVLADFMIEGHFTRHLRRMRALYAKRRRTLLEAARKLPLEIDAPEAGIHCVGWLPDGIDDLELASRAAKYDLDLTPVSNFSLEPLPRKGFCWGMVDSMSKRLRKVFNDWGLYFVLSNALTPKSGPFHGKVWRTLSKYRMGNSDKWYHNLFTNWFL
jgi:DNA-binding transcriptional MocR family regulator